MSTLLRRVAYVLCFPLLTALLAATLMAWAGSYGTYSERWCYWPKRYRADLGNVDVVSSFCLGRSRGFIILYFAQVEGDLIAEPLSTAITYSRHPPHVFGVPENGWLPRFAFRAYTENGSTGITIHRHRVDVSCSLVTLSLALPPAGAILWKRRRDLIRARRERMGLCPRCGYDLRASEGRCPECGWTDVPT